MIKDLNPVIECVTDDDSVEMIDTKTLRFVELTIF